MVDCLLTQVRKVNYTYCSTIFLLYLLLYFSYPLYLRVMIPKGTLGLRSIHMVHLITHAAFM